MRLGGRGQRNGRATRLQSVAVPVPRPDQPQIRLMHQRRRLQRLPRLLLGQLRGRQLPQLVIDQRQQLLGGLRIALLDLRQDAGHIGHAGGNTTGRADIESIVTLIPRRQLSRNVALMPGHSSQLGHRRPIERGSQQRYGFSARKLHQETVGYLGKPSGRRQIRSIPEAFQKLTGLTTS